MKYKIQIQNNFFIFSKNFSEMDNHVTELMTKSYKNGITCQKPVHLNLCLSKDTSYNELVKVVKRNCVFCKPQIKYLLKVENILFFLIF